MAKTIPGAEFMDAMRRQITVVEFIMMDANPDYATAELEAKKVETLAVRLQETIQKEKEEHQ
jgi:hypothetical protein